MPGKSFEIKGLDTVVKLFDGMLNRISNSTQVNLKMSEIAYRNVISHFGKEEGGEGKKWPLWQRKTKKGRIRYSTRPTKRGGSKLLQDSGTMRGAFKFKATRKDAIVYIVSSYYKFHHDGTKKMEKRRVLWLDYKTRKMLVKLYANYIVGK